jgi:hypothetical protein
MDKSKCSNFPHYEITEGFVWVRCDLLSSHLDQCLSTHGVWSTGTGAQGSPIFWAQWWPWCEGSRHLLSEWLDHSDLWRHRVVFAFPVFLRAKRMDCYLLARLARETERLKGVLRMVRRLTASQISAKRRKVGSISLSGQRVLLWDRNIPEDSSMTRSGEA